MLRELRIEVFATPATQCASGTGAAGLDPFAASLLNQLFETDG